MAPVPIWAKLLAVLVGVTTVPTMVGLTIVSIGSLVSTSASTTHRAAFEVSGPVRLQVDAPPAAIRIVPGPDGSVVVEQRQEVTALTRAGAAAAMRETGVDATVQDGVVMVTQTEDPPFRPFAFSRDSLVTVHVPVHTDLDIRGQSGVDIRGIDGVVRVGGLGSVTLSEVTLRGSSVLDLVSDDIDLHDVRVAGAVTIGSRRGDVRFDGTLEPGGSSLDVDALAGDATILLPRPTDARAAISTQVGDLQPDPAWGFTPDTSVGATRWVADLGPNPTGMVTVRAPLGRVTFGVR
jgi:hypothetical protein